MLSDEEIAQKHLLSNQVCNSKVLHKGWDDVSALESKIDEPNTTTLSVDVALQSFSLLEQRLHETLLAEFDLIDGWPQEEADEP